MTRLNFWYNSSDSALRSYWIGLHSSPVAELIFYLLELRLNLLSVAELISSLQMAFM